VNDQKPKPNYRNVAFMGVAIGLGIAIGRGMGNQVENFWLSLLVSAVVGGIVAGGVGLAALRLGLLNKRKNQKE